MQDIQPYAKRAVLNGKIYDVMESIHIATASTGIASIYKTSKGQYFFVLNKTSKKFDPALIPFLTQLIKKQYLVILDKNEVINYLVEWNHMDKVHEEFPGEDLFA